MKILKWLVIFLVVLGVGAFILIKILSEKLPEGQEGSAADQLAVAMQKNLNKDAYDTLTYLNWEFFRAGQKYFWDKKNNQAIIEWDDNKVIMDLDSQKAVAYSSGKQLSGKAFEEAKAKAWSNWCNDSFWLIAPFKAFDPGTKRTIVETETGSQGLLISYESGGVTPGDKYLWVLDENQRPTAWKMWTSIIPVQGMEVPWYGWEQHKGVWFGVKHKFAGKEVSLNDLKAGYSYEEFGYQTDPFEVLKKEI